MNLSGLSQPLLDAAEAIGLASGTGELDAEWFEHPLSSVGNILTSASQRRALFSLLDQLLPPEPIAGALTGEKWHPLLGPQADGNLYLTVNDADNLSVIGLGGAFGGETASLLAQIPIAAIQGGAISPVVGTAAGPLKLSLEIALDWATPAHPIALESVAVSLVFAPAAAPPVGNVVITLQSLDLDGKGAKDVTVDPASLGGEAASLVLGLMRARLAEIAGSAAGDALAVCNHLMALLGVDGTLPAFPFASLASDPQALTKWLGALAAGEPPPLTAWLGHLAGLLGVASPAVKTTQAGAQTVTTVSILAPNSASTITLGLARSAATDGATPSLGFQIGASLVPASGVPVSVEAAIALLAVPLSGRGSATLLPSASFVVQAPAGSAPLIAAAAGQFSIDAFRAGIAWDGEQIVPIIELENVVLPAAGSFRRIDLTNANTVVASAAAGLLATITNGLGTTGAGAHLAVLAGLVPPAGDPTAPILDPAQFLTGPMAAIASLHRQVLTGTARSWSIYLSELGGLLSLSGTPAGSGTPPDPWSLSMATAGSLHLDLVAWKAQTAGVDPVQLRIGLRLQVAQSPLAASWTSVLFGVDLPSSGANRVTIFAEHEAAVKFTPPPAACGNTSLSAAGISALFSLKTGAGAAVQFSIDGLSIVTPAATIALPTLPFPFPPGFDPEAPAATLGIAAAELEHTVAALLCAAFSRALGGAGTALAVLAGCGAGASGLPWDLPGIAEAAPGLLFTDPLGAVRQWVAALAAGGPAKSRDYASPIVAWVAALLSGSPPEDGVSPPPALAGSGTYDDPWQLPLAGSASAAEALLWLEPAGPAGTAPALAARVGAALDFASLVAALGSAARYLGAWPAGVDAAALTSGLQSLATHFASTDGVVPVTSQLPTGGSWGSGTPIGSAHPVQPGDPDAIRQILAQVNAWAAPGNPRAILLLGPAFSDHGTWAPLLAEAKAAQAGSTSPDAVFNLRVPGVAPASIDLRPVTAIAQFYTADLQDDGTGDIAGLAAQIGLIVARLNALLPGAPVVLVAHSTAGLAAVAYTAANASAIKGLITLGTPHAGAPLRPLTDARTADALRCIADWLPGGFPAGPLQDAFQHLLAALDGYLPGPAAGALPVAWPYPVADFDTTGHTDTGSIPALALGGAIGGAAGVNLLVELRAALAARIGGETAAAPTHLSFGVQMHLDLGPGQPASASSSLVSADAAVRMDLGRVALQAGLTDPARPARALTAALSLWRNGGWLTGGPQSYAGASAPVEVRVRNARLGVAFSDTGGTVTGTPFGLLNDVAVRGATVPSVAWSDPLFGQALGSVFAAIGSASTAVPGSTLANLLAALQALDLATPATGPGGAVGIAADAMNALAVDPVGFLTPKLAAAFAAGSVPGFSASTGGGYTAAFGSLPLEAFVTFAPGVVGLRIPAGGPGMALGKVATLTGSVALPLATMAPAVAGKLDAGAARLVYANGTLSLQAPRTNTILSLAPSPTAAEAKAALTTLLPPVVASTVASVLLDSFLPPGKKISGLLAFLASPWDSLIRSNALGNGTVLDPAKLTALFGQIGALPGGLTLTAAGMDPTTISLATGAPLRGTLSISAGVTLDRTGHAAPAATLTVDAPTTGGTWPSFAVGLGLSAAGLSLAVTPSGMAAIQFLPTFDGAATLGAGAKTLLPEALDALLSAVAPGAHPPAVTLALNAAAALDLYDAGGGFQAHRDQLAAMTGPGWFGQLSSATRIAFINAAAAYFNDPISPLHQALPGSLAAAGTTLVWSYPVPASLGAGSFSLTAGWDASGPALSAGVAGLALASGPLTATLAAGLAKGKVQISGAADLSLQSSLGLSVTPELAFSFGGGAPTLALLPLGPGTASTFSLQLAPAFHPSLAADAPVQLLEKWVIPLVGDLLLGATADSLDTPIYAGGPTAATLLLNAGLIASAPGTPPFKVKTPPPPVAAIIFSLLESLGIADIPLATDPPLDLLLGNYHGQLGVGLQGSIPLGDGSPSVALLFGQRGDARNVPGIQLSLFNAGSPPTFAPTLTVRGLGANFSGEATAPLVDLSQFRLGSIEAFLAFQFDLAHASIGQLGGGLALGQLGLPLGLLDSASSSNPVASSLLSSDAGSGGGDSSPVNPAVDVEFTYLDGSPAIRLGGAQGPIVVPVHASFGPLHLVQIDLSANGTESVTLGIDASLSVDGLNIGVDDLAAVIPVRSLLKPGDWSVDLQGLAFAFESGPVEISGGLRKSGSGGSIEYDGMLSATIVDIGFSVVGSYARPKDAKGGYTSVFLFASLLDPLGGPPFAFVTGLGGGFGYNRSLIVPTDPNQLDSFLLVEAIDDDSLANDPLGALKKMGESIPPRRGALWLAAGVRVNSFVLLNSTVLVTITVDRGLDIEIIGISRMAMPTESVALISVELALKAKFNSAEQMLSMHAQLTDNSYLFSRDCQLTGGFALVIWYGQGQFVLTLGGYHPAFTKPPQFPEVPRLGFHWSVGSLVVIKGGAYFALTNSCVMAGGSLSATVSIGPISAWFDAYVDFLVSWDPFYYSFDIGIEIGVSVSVRICFFGCVTIRITISHGARLQIAGPPFHGSVSIDAYITTITVAFGEDPLQPSYITDWRVFADTYLTPGDPGGSPISLQIAAGLLPPEPPGAQPQPGTESQPWQLGQEFQMVTTTRMPASSAPPDWFGAPIEVPADLNVLDLAAMDRIGVTSTHWLMLEERISGSWQTADVQNAPDHFTFTAVKGFFPEATWHWTDPEHLPAAARTIAAISGFTIEAHVVLSNRSDAIPISTLVNDQPQDALPLPFAPAPLFVSFGIAADGLAASVAQASSEAMLTASHALLTGKSGLAGNRAALDLSPQALTPLSAQALLRNRSAPPLLTPLSTGLSMKPVGLPAPTLASVPAPALPVLLAAPRLRAVLQPVPVPVADAPPAPHTSVSRLLPALLKASPRMAPPASLAPVTVPGARLLIVPAATAPRPTRAARTARALRHADLGAAVGPAHQAVLDRAAADFAEAGVALGAGAMHLWDVPDDRGACTIAGDGAVRMLCLNRGGAPLRDVEFAAAGSAAQRFAPGTAMLAIQCLGSLPPDVTAPDPSFGAIAGNFAPAGEAAALGWQSASLLLQVAPTRFLARGATVRIVRPHATRRNGQRASSGTPRAAEVIDHQAGVETTFPPTVSVVALALDTLDAAAGASGDLAIGCSGGTLSDAPARVATGGRVLLLYDVVQRDAGANALIVSAASAAVWSLGGVIGLHGKAAEWANTLAQGLPDHFVPDGALSPGGALTVTYTGGST